MSLDHLTLPAKDLETAFRACDPAEPLEPGDPRYADFQDLRRNKGMLTRHRQFLAPLESGHQQGCFCGHRGSGKSTELLAFRRWAAQNGFLAIVTEVDEHLGLGEIEFSDLYLLAASSIEAAMKEFGSEIPQENLKHVVAWFSEITKEDHEEVKSEIGTELGTQIGGNLFNLGSLFAKITAGVKAGSIHATTIRSQIRNSPDRLIDLTNSLIDAANEQLARQGRTRGLLLLFDNLDRYDPVIIDKLLYRGSNLIRRMKCHAVYTIPIALEYEPLSGAIQDCYGFSIVLPMLALRDRATHWGPTVAESAYLESAMGTVRQALALRLDLDLFEEPADIDLLIKMSGGCIRDLMHLVTLAFGHSDEATVFTPSAVQKAIHEMRATYVRRISADDYTALAAIARRDGELNNSGDGTHKRRLLYNRFALEYLDENDQPWVDIHPLVIETEGFRRAINA